MPPKVSTRRLLSNSRRVEVTGEAVIQTDDGVEVKTVMYMYYCSALL